MLCLNFEINLLINRLWPFNNIKSMIIDYRLISYKIEFLLLNLFKIKLRQFKRNTQKITIIYLFYFLNKILTFFSNFLQNLYILCQLLNFKLKKFLNIFLNFDVHVKCCFSKAPRYNQIANSPANEFFQLSLIQSAFLLFLLGLNKIVP